MKNIFLLFVFTVLISSCGGGSNSDSLPLAKDDAIPTQSHGIRVSEYLLHYSGTSKGEFETTTEYETRIQKKIEALSTTILILDKKHVSYNADTGMAHFNIGFNYVNKNNLIGPTFLIKNNHTRFKSGIHTVSMHSSDYIVFKNLSEASSFYLIDGLLGSCESTKSSIGSIHSTIKCNISAYIDRNTLQNDEIALRFHLSIDSVKYERFRSSFRSGRFSTTVNIKKYYPTILNKIDLFNITKNQPLGSLIPIKW